MSAEKIKHDIPLGALGRLSHSEELELEAALADDPRLAAELREHEEIIAGLWHSAAPLQTMPRSAWGELQERLQESKPKAPGTTLPFTRWLGGLGWAAALALGLYLWSDRNPPREENKQASEPGDTQTSTRTRIIESHPGDTETERRIRERLVKVQEKLTTALADRDSATLASHVIELYPPGESAIDSPEIRSQKLLRLLTEALGHNLQRLDEETVSLIIEEGWLDVALQSLPAEATIRHRTFPTEHFGDYDLLRSPEGAYFDPSSKFLWKPAPDGGGYLGSLAPEDLDLSNFSGAPEIKEFDDSTASESRLADLPRAQGYLVRNEHGDLPSFVLNGINPSTDAITVRQGDRTANLEPPLLAANSIPDGTSLTGPHFQASSNTPTDVSSPMLPPPQLMEISEFNSDQIIWSEPFEIIQVDAQGNASVILTTQP